MDTISPTKRSVSPLTKRMGLRSVILGLPKNKKQRTKTDDLILKDAQRRLLQCEANIANIAADRLLDAGWKLKTEISVPGSAVRVYKRCDLEGLVYLKTFGDLTAEIVNTVGSDILIDTLSGRALQYVRSYGIKQRILTNGWGPDLSRYVLDRFKGLIELEDTATITMSSVVRPPPAAVTGDKSSSSSSPKLVTPTRKKRPSSAFYNISAPVGKRVKL